MNLFCYISRCFCYYLARSSREFSIQSGRTHPYNFELIISSFFQIILCHLFRFGIEMSSVKPNKTEKKNSNQTEKNLNTRKKKIDIHLPHKILFYIFTFTHNISPFLFRPEISKRECFHYVDRYKRTSMFVWNMFSRFCCDLCDKTGQHSSLLRVTI